MDLEDPDLDRGPWVRRDASELAGPKDAPFFYSDPVTEPSKAGIYPETDTSHPDQPATSSMISSGISKLAYTF